MNLPRIEEMVSIRRKPEIVCIVFALGTWVEIGVMHEYRTNRTEEL
jgi:hypothetical protein